MAYQPPIRDMAFALLEQAGLRQLQSLRPDLDLDTVMAVLDTAGDLARDVMAPLNRPGDLAGTRFENGQVVAAPGFAQAYRQFAAGGWSGLTAAADHGGQGLPKMLEIAVFEMFHAANMALTLCPMLTLGAIEALAQHGTDFRKRGYCQN